MMDTVCLRVYIHRYLYVSYSPVRILWNWVCLLHPDNYDRHQCCFSHLRHCMSGANYVEITEVYSQRCAMCSGGLSCIKGGAYGNIYERPIWEQSTGHYNSYYGNSANNWRQWNMLCHAYSTPPRYDCSVYVTFSPHENKKKIPQNWRYRNKFPLRIILDKYYNIWKKINNEIYFICSPLTCACVSDING
jgi:hypothetical protein